MICKKCNKEFPRFMSIDGVIRDLGQRSFCIDCSPLNSHNASKILNNKNNCCIHCQKPLINRQKIFCSLECQKEHEYEEYVNRWKKGLEDGMNGQYSISLRIKRYLFEKYNNQCCKCGWHEINPSTNKTPLEVHHRDGDYTNNDEENLELLCPNCHSLTNTYKNSNQNGRKQRQKYSS